MSNMFALMQVLGCAKGVVATVVSVLLFRDQITPLGILGYFFTVAGVFTLGPNAMQSSNELVTEMWSAADSTIAGMPTTIWRPCPATSNVIHVYPSKDFECNRSQ